ncbi:MAG: 5-deoxy-glucuronate isomerase [Acidobacteria bacterium]|nr:MAG: 5-deoxy-glucuronate isomerase [Acidobacteriota bacterium]
MARTVKLRSRIAGPRESRVLVSITPQQAGWRYVRFSVRQIAAQDSWRGSTTTEELCLVLLEGRCRVSWDGVETDIGPRRDVFSGYPHAVYLPKKTPFTVDAIERTVIADCRAPSTAAHPARVITPEDCGFEIRGGGNATRQIVDILPPAFPAGRLMICEVFTPSGNWSSYPPHKHDKHTPPSEVDLDEVYYYRFKDPDAYGIQRLYGPGDRGDQAVTVRGGDLVLVREGYHPFVAAHGYDAYYLNVLAGSARSMAASDDPRYAGFRARWPEPDPRVPVVQPPRRAGL